MSKPQLSVRSARARDLAHSLARRERRTVAAVVERALEEYAARHSVQIPPETFYRGLAESRSADVDLETILREHRRPHRGIDL